jgi:hypothetical protein
MPILRQEVPSAPTDAPNDLQDTLNDLQETPNDLQETPDDPQDTSQVGNKMTTFSWRDLTFDKDANTHLLDHFCRMQEGHVGQGTVQAR